MRYLLTLVVLLVVTGCSAKSVYIEKSVDLIPQEAALEYLSSEEVMGYSYPAWMCVFSSVGVHMLGGYTPYADLEFMVFTHHFDSVAASDRENRVVVLRKDSSASCAAYLGPNDDGQLNKIATALFSLGIELNNEKLEEF